MFPPATLTKPLLRPTNSNNLLNHLTTRNNYFNINNVVGRYESKHIDDILLTINPQK